MLGLLLSRYNLLCKAVSKCCKEIELAAKRLVDRLGIGTEYKVMALTPKRSKRETAFLFVKGTKSSGSLHLKQAHCLLTHSFQPATTP